MIKSMVMPLDQSIRTGRSRKYEKNENTYKKNHLRKRNRAGERDTVLEAIHK
jgi:hypothetical protein